MNALAQHWSQRFAAWTAEREGTHRGEALLDRHRVYILPTRAGLVFAVMLLALLLGSINYALQLGFLLTFFVAGIALAAMFHTHRNLTGLGLRAHGAANVFAGDLAIFEISASNSGKEPRYAIGLKLLATGAPAAVSIDLSAASARIVRLGLPTTKRGRAACPRIRIETRFPLGLWRAWAYFTPALEAVVYPAPEADAPPLPPALDGDGDQSATSTHGTDFAGVRPYQVGDTQRMVAWRLAARADELTVKLFDASGGGELMLDIAALPHLPLEAQLSRLARWLLAADARHMRYGLRLPSATIPPATGAQHRERCLVALALA